MNLDDLPYVELNTNLGGAAAGLEPGLRGAVRHAPVAGRHGRAATAISRCRATCSTRPPAASPAVHFRRHDLSRPGGAQRPELRRAQGRDLCGVPGLRPGGDSRTTGPQGLDQISPELYEAYEEFGAVPSIFQIPFVPFQFDINASATTLTQPEFVAQPTQQADELRAAILADSTAPTALENLAADQTTFENLYLAGLEQAGVLLPDGTTPPISQNPLIMSLMATLATGVLAGPGRQRNHLERQRVAVLQRAAQLVRQQHRSDRAGGRITTSTAIRSPPCRPSSQYNLNATLPTNFEDFNVYVPWVRV